MIERVLYDIFTSHVNFCPDKGPFWCPFMCKPAFSSAYEILYTKSGVFKIKTALPPFPSSGASDYSTYIKHVLTTQNDAVYLKHVIFLALQETFIGYSEDSIGLTNKLKLDLSHLPNDIQGAITNFVKAYLEKEKSETNGTIIPDTYQVSVDIIH